VGKTILYSFETEQTCLSTNIKGMCEETVYRDFIPEFPISNDRPAREITRMLGGLEPTINFWTLEDALYDLSLHHLENPEHDVLYDRTTPYWNGLGACLAFNQITHQLSALLNVEIAPYRLEGLRTFRRPVLTGWGGAFDPIIIENRLFATIRAPSSTLVFDNKVPNRGHCRVHSNKAQRGRVLLFCDSYTFNVWWQFFAERFGVVILAHQSAMDRGFVEFVKPDVVIVAVVERFLIWPVSDAVGPSFLTLSETLKKEQRAGLEEALRPILSSCDS
jgi:hypothetical protein